MGIHSFHKLILFGLVVTFASTKAENFSTIGYENTPGNVIRESIVWTITGRTHTCLQNISFTDRAKYVHSYLTAVAWSSTSVRKEVQSLFTQLDENVETNFQALSTSLKGEKSGDEISFRMGLFIAAAQSLHQMEAPYDSPENVGRANALAHFYEPLFFALKSIIQTCKNDPGKLYEFVNKTIELCSNPAQRAGILLRAWKVAARESEESDLSPEIGEHFNRMLDSLGAAFCIDEIVPLRDRKRIIF
jgi:hypothetical protein